MLGGQVEPGTFRCKINIQCSFITELYPECSLQYFLRSEMNHQSFQYCFLHPDKPTDIPHLSHTPIPAGVLVYRKTRYSRATANRKIAIPARAMGSV